MYHFSPEHRQLGIQGGELPSRWRRPRRRRFTASLGFTGGPRGRWGWLAALAVSAAQIEAAQAPRQRG